MRIRADVEVGADEVIGCIEMPRSDGRPPVRIESRERIGAAMQELGYDEEVGFGLGDIVRAAKRLARSRAVASMLMVAQKITRHPLLGSVLPPGARAIVDATIRARTAIVRARRGDRTAQQSILRARQAAQRDPRITQAFEGAHRLWRDC